MAKREKREPEPAETPEEQQLRATEDLAARYTVPEGEIPAGEGETGGEKPPAEEGEPKARGKGRGKAGAEDEFGDVVARGADFGISEDEIRAFGNADVAGRVLDLLDREQAKFGASLRELRSSAREAPSGPQGRRREAGREAEPPPGASDAVKALRKKLEEADVDPAVIEAFDGIGKLIAGAGGKREGARGASEEEQPEVEIDPQVQAEIDRKFDGFVTALGKGWESIFGRGRRNALRVGSPAWENRFNLATVADQIERAEIVKRRSGGVARAMPTEDEILQRALKIAFPEEAKALLEEEVVDRLKKHGRRIVQRPTSRRSSDMLSSTERAAKFFDERKGELGG